MIRVNLLPAEYRKAEATPLKQFFATVGAVVLGTLAAVAWGYVHYALLVPAIKTKEQLEEDIRNQAAGLETTKKLDAKVRELKEQFQKIDEVAKNRIVWSREMDLLWDIVVNPTPPDKYKVWLDNISCATTTGGLTSKVGGTVQFAGTSAGAQGFRMADFWEDLRTSPLFKSDFQTITPPYGQRTVIPPSDRDPPEGWTFNFKLDLKSLKDINDARAKAAAEAAKQ